MVGQRQASSAADHQLCSQSLFQCVQTSAHHDRRHALGMGRCGQAAMGHDLHKGIDFFETVHGDLRLIQYLEYRMKVSAMQFPNRSVILSIDSSSIQLCKRKPHDPYDSH